MTTNRKITRRTLTGAATGALFAAAWLGPLGTGLSGAATPSQTGCPAAYSLLSVADLTQQGYHAPSQIDPTPNGGNGDGFVCGKPVQEQAAENYCGGPCQHPVLYEFRDNSLTPNH